MYEWRDTDVRWSRQCCQWDLRCDDELDARQPRMEGKHSRQFEWKLFPELFVARAPSCTHLITECVVCYSVSINFQFSMACRMSVAEEQTFSSHAHADTHLPANSDSVMKRFVVERSRIYSEWMHCVLRRCICLPIHSSTFPIAFFFIIMRLAWTKRKMENSTRAIAIEISYTYFGLMRETLYCNIHYRLIGLPRTACECVSSSSPSLWYASFHMYNVQITC